MPRQRTTGAEEDVATAAEGAGGATPWGAILGGAGGIIGALTSWYAVGEQRKMANKTLDMKDKWFQQNFGAEQEQFGEKMAFSREQLSEVARSSRKAERLAGRQERRAGRTARAGVKLAERELGLRETESEATRELAGRRVGVEEKVAAADIEYRKRDIGLQEKQVKFNQAATLMTNMTKFFNSPQNSEQYASLWRRAS